MDDKSYLLLLKDFFEQKLSFIRNSRHHKSEMLYVIEWNNYDKKIFSNPDFAI